MRAYIVVFALFGGMLCPRISSAMSPEMFDNMAPQDQRAYVSFLAKSAEQVFAAEGRQDVALQVHTLFSSSGKQASPGGVQLEECLRSAGTFMAAHPIKGFKFTVEDAFTQVLGSNRIPMPNAFRREFVQATREKPFWPKLPLRAN